MRYRYLFAVAIVVVACTLPCATYAFDNKVVLSFESGEGETIASNIDKETYTFSYRRYFQSLADGGSPYGAREFLQHPSYLNISFAATKYWHDMSPPANYMKQEYLEYIVSGIYYIGKDRRTGIGAAYLRTDGKFTGALNGDVKETVLALTIQQYLTENLRLTLDYDRAIEQEAIASEWETYAVDVATLVDMYWLRAWYSYSWYFDLEESLEATGIEFGLYPTNELGIFASYERTDEEGIYKISGEYWLSESSSLGIVYKWVKEDPGYFRGETATFSYEKFF